LAGRAGPCYITASSLIPVDDSQCPCRFKSNNSDTRETSCSVCLYFPMKPVTMAFMPEQKASGRYQRVRRRARSLLTVREPGIPFAVGLIVVTVSAAAFGLYLESSRSRPPVLSVRPSPPHLDLAATYEGRLECQEACRRLVGTETLTVDMPEIGPPRLAESVVLALSGADWVPAPGSRASELHFRRQARHQSPPIPNWWPGRSWRLELPSELFPDPLIIAWFPPTPGFLQWPVDRRWEASDDRAQARLVISDKSYIVLTHDRFAISATSPGSETQDAAGGKEERRIELADTVAVSNSDVGVELIAPWARSEPGLMVASLTWPGLMAAAAVSVAILAWRSGIKRLSSAARAMGMAPFASRRVFVSASGDVYHRTDCHTLGPRSKAVPSSLWQAKREGRLPCRNCHPQLRAIRTDKPDNE